MPSTTLWPRSTASPARVSVVPGGASRQESVAAGLAELADLSDDDAVLVHDAARPFMPVAVFGRLLEAIEHHDAAIPVLPVVDTIVSGVGGDVAYLDRDAPRGRPDAPGLPHRRGARCAQEGGGRRHRGDGRRLARAPLRLPLATVEGDPLGRKITYPEDIEAFERRLSSR